MHDLNEKGSRNIFSLSDVFIRLVLLVLRHLKSPIKIKKTIQIR